MSAQNSNPGSQLPAPQQARLAAFESDFRDDLENKHGRITIASEEFDPAEVLKQMAPLAYDAALAGFVNDRIENALDRGCREFPTPIASCLQRALHGTSDPVTQILLFRDANEAFINTLMSIVIGECLHRGIKLGGVEILVGRASVPKRLSLSHLTNDRMADRIAVVRAVLKWAKANNIGLKAADLLPVAAVERLQNLHYVRCDEISHAQTPPPADAPIIAAQMREELIDVVLDFEDLTQFELIRFQNLEPGNLANVEVLYGFAGRWMETRTLTPNGVLKCAGVPSNNHLLIHCDGEVFDASPYLHSQQDGTGSHTQTLILKSEKSSVLAYQVCGHRGVVSLPAGGANPDPTTLNALF